MGTQLPAYIHSHVELVSTDEERAADVPLNQIAVKQTENNKQQQGEEMTTRRDQKKDNERKKAKAEEKHWEAEERVERCIGAQLYSHSSFLPSLSFLLSFLPSVLPHTAHREQFVLRP